MPKTFKLCQSGKILPNLVTLILGCILSARHLLAKFFLKILIILKPIHFILVRSQKQRG